MDTTIFNYKKAFTYLMIGIITLSLLVVSYLSHVNSSTAATINNSNSLDLKSGETNSTNISDADQVGLDISGDMTIMMWVKPETNSGNQALVSKWNQSIKTAYILYMEDGDLGLHINAEPSGFGYSTYRVPHGKNANEWYHIAVVYKSASGTAEFFVDGVSVGKSDDNTMPTSIANNDADFVIGGREDGVSNFVGQIDEVRIWNRALNANKISNFFSDPVGTNSGPDIQGYWKFNGNLNDRSTNNNDLGVTFSTDTPF